MDAPQPPAEGPARHGEARQTRWMHRNRRRWRSSGTARHARRGGCTATAGGAAVEAATDLRRRTACAHLPTAPDLGSLRADLHALIGGLCEALGTSRWAALMPSLIDAAERDPEFAEVHRRFAATRTAPIREIIDRGIARGELPDDIDVDQLIDLLSGPIFYRRLVAGQPVDRAYAERLLDRVLLAYRPSPTPASVPPVLPPFG